MKAKGMTFDANVICDEFICEDNKEDNSVQVRACPTHVPANVAGVRVIVAPGMSPEDSVRALEKIVERVRARHEFENLRYADRIERAADHRELLEELDPVDRFAAVAIQLQRKVPCNAHDEDGYCAYWAHREGVEGELLRLKREIMGEPKEADTDSAAEATHKAVPPEANN